MHLGESHEFCARIMGTDFLTSYMISSRALHWKKPSDRLGAIDSRTVVCLQITSFSYFWFIKLVENFKSNSSHFLKSLKNLVPFH